MSKKEEPKKIEPKKTEPKEIHKMEIKTLGPKSIKIVCKMIPKEDKQKGK